MFTLGVYGSTKRQANPPKDSFPNRTGMRSYQQRCCRRRRGHEEKPGRLARVLSAEVGFLLLGEHGPQPISETRMLRPLLRDRAKRGLAVCESSLADGFLEGFE